VTGERRRVELAAEERPEVGARGQLGGDGRVDRVALDQHIAA